MATPVSSATPYCNAVAFLTRYDWTTIAKLMADGKDTAVPTKDRLLDAATTEGLRLYTILADASGEVEMATMAGGKYKPSDLQAMTGNQASKLQGIVSDIAIWKCYLRRPNPQMQMPAQTQQAYAVLQALEAGQLVFGLQENIDASVLDTIIETPPVIDNRRMITSRCRPLFGDRNNRSIQRP